MFRKFDKYTDGSFYQEHKTVIENGAGDMPFHAVLCDP